jgi:hypothetical protein
MIHTWKGKEIDTLSREELIEIIKFLIHEMEVLIEAVAQSNTCFKKTKER